MEITLTKKQLESLIRVVFLGNWVANAWRRDGGREGGVLQEYDELESHILMSALRHGLRKCLDFDEGEGVAYPSAKLEEEMRPVIEEYNDDTFWDEIIVRMADRDFIRRFGEKAFQDLPEQVFNEEWEPLADKYEKEFIKNGIDRLELRRDN